MGMVAWPLAGVVLGRPKGLLPWASRACPAGVSSPPPAAWAVGTSATTGDGPSVPPTAPAASQLDCACVSLPGLPGGQAASVPEAGAHLL